jgi:TonB family protein
MKPTKGVRTILFDFESNALLEFRSKVSFMLMVYLRSHLTISAALARTGVTALALALASSAQAQTPAQPAATLPAPAPAAQSNDTQPPAPPAPSPVVETPQPAVAQVPADPAPTTGAAAGTPQAQLAPPQVVPGKVQRSGMTEAELKQLLVGKALFLRDGYLGDSLSFNEHGRLIGHSPQGSYTLSAIQIDRARLSKHKVELEGARYGMHFLGQLAFEDTSSSVDRVRITPKKKAVKITIDREMVVSPKKKKDAKADTEVKIGGRKSRKSRRAEPAELSESELTEAEQLKASIAAVPEAERPADSESVTTTTSPAHATKVLKEAIDQIFAQGLDERMMAAMPDFWKLYYQAVAAKADYRPADPSIFRQNAVDQKARLLTNFEPDSNEFAQANGIAGPALFHTIIGADGKVGEVAVARPIGFGLDENAVAAIRKASFQPAIKDGQPVAVMLDLYVSFRIFSKRTDVVAPHEPADKSVEPILPGPYSLPRP